MNKKSYLKIQACVQNHHVFFRNPTTFTYFIPSIVQNNILSTKVREKSKRIKKTQRIKDYEGDLWVQKNVESQCLPSKMKLSMRRWRVDTEIVRESENISYFHSFQQ